MTKEKAKNLEDRYAFRNIGGHSVIVIIGPVRIMPTVNSEDREVSP